jgi:hypothetical protein
MRKLRCLLCTVTAAMSLVTVVQADQFTTGLYNEWVGDDYVPGNSWVDRVSGVAAVLDGNPTPPISVAGVFGTHSGVQQDPNGSFDAGFSIPSFTGALNPPSGDTNYTISAVIYSESTASGNTAYYGANLIMGYDIGGPGQTDWGISYGGNGGSGIDAGIGLGNGNDQGLNSPALSLYAVHAVALQVGNGKMSLYVDGALSAQATGLPIQAPNPNNGNAAGVIPLLSTVGSNIGQVFAGLLAEVRIYTNSTVDAAGLTAYLITNYTASETITLSTPVTGAIVGSNALVTFSVPPSFTASTPGTLTLTSANTAVTASQTITLPAGVSSTNVTFPILSVGSSVVTATASGLGNAILQINGALPTITFAPSIVSTNVGDDADVTLTLTCPYPFSGPYSINLASDNSAVSSSQTVSLPGGVASTNLTLPVLSTGLATLTASGTGLNSGILSVGTFPQILNAGMASQWVADDYTVGNSWVDRVAGVEATLDGNPTPPISVSGDFGTHNGVQRDPAGGANDAGFSIPGNNAPTGNSNYTVVAVVYPTTVAPGGANYYQDQLIVGYDIGGAGQTDWGISWGNPNEAGFVAGIGLANGNDNGQRTTANYSLNTVHAVALQVGNGVMSFFADGSLVQTTNNLPLHAPANSNGGGAIPLLSSVDSNIGQTFSGALAELRIYTNSVVDAAALTASLVINYNLPIDINLSSNITGAIVGSNAVVSVKVPSSVTASSPFVITLTSDNTAVTANQTVTLPVGVTSTNLIFPILSVGQAAVTASSPGVAPELIDVTGALPTVTFSHTAASASVGSNAVSTLILTCPYAFSGPYTVTLTSANPAVVANQTVTVPAGTDSTNLAFPILATGFANLTATASGLNSAQILIGTVPQLYASGLSSDWVGDDYTPGNGWVDRVAGVVAALDGNPVPPVSVSGLFGTHLGVQQNPTGGASDGGFLIPGDNAPSGFTNYTVVATIYPDAAGPVNDNYYGADLIVGYDIGGAGQTDWGISWGGFEGMGIDAGIGLANGNDQPLNSTALTLNAVHTVALQVANGTMSLYVDGLFSAQATNLPIQAPNPNNGNGHGVIPLLTGVDANIGGSFQGALAELRIYTNSVLDGGSASAYMQTNNGGILGIPPGPNIPTILPVQRDTTGTNLVLSVVTQTGFSYYLLSTTNLTPPIIWTTNSTTVGTGSTITNTVPISTTLESKEFYRYLVQ